MQRRLLSILSFLLAMACAAGCAAPGPVSRQGDFLRQEHVSIGVALRVIGAPGIRSGEKGYKPPAGVGPGYDRMDVYSDQGGESETGPRKGGVLGSPVPPSQGAYSSLESQLAGVGSDALREGAKKFAQGIERPGWRVVPLGLAVDEVVPDAPYLKGLDALIILDYTWYGAYCGSAAPEVDLSDAGADLRGRMIELSTGRTLWQSRDIGIRNPLWCRCDDPACREGIAAGVREAVCDAQEAALRDFLGETP
jgi:hypothetical protein